MNKHPKSENILKVIQNFEKVLPMAKHEDHLQMMSGGIHKTSCGTYACAGGWYVYSIKNRVGQDRELRFTDGIRGMSIDLGIDPSSHVWASNNLISGWAMENPELWGNQYGLAIFADARAYRSLPVPKEPKPSKI